MIDRADVVSVKGTDNHIAARLANKRWRLLHPGVYLVGCAPPTWEQRALAGVRACGGDARTSHSTGVAVYGLDGCEENGVIHVTMTQADRPAPDGVRVHRSRRPLKGTRTVRGIPVASVERSLLDYGAVADDLAVERAVESALDRHLTAERRLWAVLTQEGGRGVPGSARLRRVLLNRPRGLPAKSVLEIEVGHLLKSGGLGHFVRNLPVLNGKFKIDAAFVDETVAIEADSRQFHSTKTQRANDKARQDELEAAGWHFERITFDDVHLDPDDTLAHVRAALEARSNGGANAVLRSSTSA